MTASDDADWSDEPERTTVEIAIRPTPLPVSSGHHEQLLVVVGDEPGRAFDIGDGVVIGRDPACQVALAETSVSRRHARIVRTGEHELRIDDLESRNGTLVNGLVVRSHPLAIGDRIQVGPRVVLVLTHEDPLRSMLRERQKMEVIGRMAAGVAHDFNNVTAAALATCDHLEGELAAMGALRTSSIAECVRDLRMVLERSADLTRSLASLGRKKPRTPAGSVDLAVVCEEVARLCERTFGPSFEIRRRWRGTLLVRAHRTELHQILVNLCLNARDAMQHGGTLRIAAERGSGATLGETGRDWILLRVADTGAGMSEEVRRRIFEPFFTTKQEGRGSGLGLATVHELVASMGGRIEVESAPGRGTVFLVWLPADPSANGVSEMRTGDPGGPPAAREPRRRSPAAVLVVEDQEIVRRSIVRLLVAAGHRVETAGDGAEALRVFERASPRPGLVLLDLDLPVMGGEEALRHLRELDPDVKVLAVSGHWDPDRQAALLRAGAVGFLGKPFDGPTLHAAIAQALAPA